MQTQEIYETITPILHDIFDNEKIEATPTLSARDITGWDTLSNIRLMLTVQKTFGVKFSTAEIGRLKNVGELANLIQSKL